MNGSRVLISSLDRPSNRPNLFATREMANNHIELITGTSDYQHGVSRRSRKTLFFALISFTTTKWSIRLKEFNVRIRIRSTPLNTHLSRTSRHAPIRITAEFLDAEIINASWLSRLWGASEHAYVMLQGTLEKCDISAMDQHICAKVNKSGLLLQVTPKMYPCTNFR